MPSVTHPPGSTPILGFSAIGVGQLPWWSPLVVVAAYLILFVGYAWIRGYAMPVFDAKGKARVARIRDKTRRWRREKE